MTTTQAPIKNYKLYNKADIARHLGISRVYVSKLMRGLVKNNKRLLEIKKFIGNQNRAA